MLEGKYVNMRPIMKSDLKYIKEWINDLEVQYYSQEKYPSYFDSWTIKNIYSDGIRGYKPIFIIEDKSGDVIGELWLDSLDMIRGSAELVIVIGKSLYRGIGYGKDAINTIKGYCFNVLGLESLYLKVFSFNLRGINCYKACGFKVKGRGPGRVIRYGAEYDELVMEVRRSDHD